MPRIPRFSLYALGSLLVAVAIVAVTAAPASAATGFGDIDDEEFYADAVAWMVDQGITTGIEAGCFGPGEPVTRGQVAAFLFRLEAALGNDPDPAEHPFDDVVFEYQQAPIGWLFDAGVTTGTSGSTFEPEAAVTRGDFATLLWRYAGEPAAPEHEFADIDLPYQDVAVAWMAAEGITRGTTPTTFDPHSAMTRSEVAAFLFRYVDPAEVPTITSTVECTRTMRAALVAGGLTLDEAACAAPWLTDFNVEYLSQVAHDMAPASMDLILAVAIINDEGCIAEHRFGELSRLYL